MRIRLSTNAVKRTVDILTRVVCACYDGEVYHDSVWILFCCEITYFFSSLQENVQNNAVFPVFPVFCHLDMKYRETRISYKRNSVAWVWEQKISDDDQKKYFSKRKDAEILF